MLLSCCNIIIIINNGFQNTSAIFKCFLTFLFQSIVPQDLTSVRQAKWMTFYGRSLLNQGNIVTSMYQVYKFCYETFVIQIHYMVHNVYITENNDILQHQISRTLSM